MAEVSDRSSDLSRRIDTVSGPRFIAKCGHESVPSYFAGTECENCVGQKEMKKRKEARKQRIKEKNKNELVSMLRTR